MICFIDEPNLNIKKPIKANLNPLDKKLNRTNKRRFTCIIPHEIVITLNGKGVKPPKIIISHPISLNLILNSLKYSLKLGSKLKM